jgi:hypothetical protein
VYTISLHVALPISPKPQNPERERERARNLKLNKI